MGCRGIRGAITAAANDRDAILGATAELLLAMQDANGFQPEELGAAFFTVTPDLTAAFPAAAARGLGWGRVPLLDAAEIDVPGALSLCIRVMLLWNSDRPQNEVHHCYMRGASHLRPDLAPGDGKNEGGEKR